MARLRESDSLPAEAKRSKDRIEQDSARRPTGQCAKCGRRHFQRHQKRRRWFLQVVERLVRQMRCVLYRWRCANCGTTFTHLPSSCVPYQRYLRPAIEAHASAYVETDPMSYRRVVQERGAALSYDDPIAGADSTEAEKENERVRALAPSTVHRWISGMAARREGWQPVVRLAGQLHPGARLSSILIAAAKYRSAARQRVLETCGLLLRALSIVASRNPTQFATLGSSP